MLTREAAVDLTAFTNECEIAYAFDHTGEIVYAVSAAIGIPGNFERHGASFGIPGQKTYDEQTVAQGILNLWTELARTGHIGRNTKAQEQGVTLTGEPLQDLIQLGSELMGIPTQAS